MTNPLLKAIDAVKKEQDKKKKPTPSLPKEKRLSYYSGWGNKSVDMIEKQDKLC